MTFSAIALADLPSAVHGPKSKPIPLANMVTADAIAAIIAAGQAARSGNTYETRGKAEMAGRKYAALVNKAEPPLANGLVYRFRVLTVGDTFTFVVVSGTAPKPRGPRAPKVATEAPAEVTTTAK